MPRITTEERKRLAAEQHRWRSVQGSRNGARLWAKFARRHKDALHRATTTIVKNQGVVVIEDLKARRMTQTGRGTVEGPGT